jgi:hypothetical protein
VATATWRPGFMHRHSNLQKQLTFNSPNLASTFHPAGRSKEFAQTRNTLHFTVSSWQYLVKHLDSPRVTKYFLSHPSHLQVASSVRNLRTPHAVMSETQLRGSVSCKAPGVGGITTLKWLSRKNTLKMSRRSNTLVRALCEILGLPEFLRLLGCYAA